MRKTVIACALVLSAFASVTACTNMNPIQQGALSGGAIGAAGGAGLSAISGGSAGIGAIIGGGLGALAGGIVGHHK